MADMNNKKQIVLTKKDINKSYIRWLFFSHSCYNYERLQGLGVAHAMTPILKKLYTTKEERAEALQRSMAFFNCEPTFASLIHGLTIAVEEQKANGADIPDETINAFKTSLMGPLSGIGDSLLQGLLAVVLLSIGIDLAMDGNILGPMVFFLGTAVPVWIFTYIFYHKGYSMGKNAISDILSNNRISKITNAAGIAGLAVIGSMAATKVSLKVPVVFTSGESKVVLQEVLDKILPNMLPLLVVLLCWKLLNKRWTPTKVIIFLFVVGFLGSIIGIFG